MSPREEILAYLEPYLTPRALAFVSEHLPEDYFEHAEIAIDVIHSDPEEVVEFYCGLSVIPKGVEVLSVAEHDTIQRELHIRKLGKALLGKNHTELDSLRELFGGARPDPKRIIQSVDPEVVKFRSHLGVCLVIDDLLNGEVVDQAVRIANAILEPEFGQEPETPIEDTSRLVNLLYDLKDLQS